MLLAAVAFSAAVSALQRRAALAASSAPPTTEETTRVLVVSNGHGEDAIGAMLCAALRAAAPRTRLSALPLVGNGDAYRGVQGLDGEEGCVDVIGPARAMPSGGFVYMDPSALAADVKAGLAELTAQQWRAASEWSASSAGDASKGRAAAVLVVGDMLPLLFARWACAPLPYAFVGCAKSEHYVRDAARSEQLRFPERGLEALAAGGSGSVYLPWETALIGAARCVAAMPRDAMTARRLAGAMPADWPGRVRALGNPMMDLVEVGAEATTAEASREGEVTRALRAAAAHAGARDAVVVLPGTRWPEAGANMRTLLEAAAHAQDDEGGPIEGSEGGGEKKRGAPVLLLAPVPGGFPGDEVGAIIEAEGWVLSELQEATTRGLPTGSVRYTRRARAAPGRGEGASRGKIPNAQNDAWSLLLLPAPAFAPALFASTLGLCMAGTATEQLVGLGRRAFTVACGAGPQFTPAFAEAQVRLLGADSVRLADTPAECGEALREALLEPAASRAAAEAAAKANGAERMGTPGAAARIAEALIEDLRLAV